MKNTFSEALEIALGVQNPRPREISQSSGMYFPMHSSSRQCTDSDSRIKAVYGHSLIINPSLGMYTKFIRDIPVGKLV